MNSIRASLVAMLVAAFTLVSFLATLNAYRSSLAETEKLLDAQLQHVSGLLRLHSDRGEVPSAPSESEPESEPESELTYQVWRGDMLLRRSSRAPDAMINELAEGFRYANFGGYRWRTLTRLAPDGDWYVVAQRADLRHTLAERAALASVQPLLMWLPVSAVLVWVLVGWGLRPLRELSRQINLRRSDDLAPIRYVDPPRELVQLVSSTNSLFSRLAASFEREKHFAAHAAHELRTPLSALKVHLHNLSLDLPPDHPGLAHANAGVERMQHLIKQILDLNRTNPEIIEAKFRKVDLHSLAQRVTAEVWPDFAVRQQSLSLAGESVTLFGDESMLETMLLNLLDNAGKYTPRGGEIDVFAGRVGDGVELRVVDSGPGIPETERDRVFERFYRGSGDAVVSGSGLGLAIVHHIAVLHGAVIRLERSHFPSGLAVIVAFPAEAGG